MSSFAVLLPPPCTNADLHLGHLSAVYIPADIYARYLALCGHDVLTISGADQNNTYTKAKADALSMGFDEAKTSFAEKIERSLSLAGIKVDAFENTDTERHRSVSRDIVKSLLARDMVQARSVPQFYCRSCDAPICDTEVCGTCGRCGAGSESGICENCNSFIFDRFLLAPKHKACGSACETSDRTGLTFELEKCRDRLLQLVQDSRWDPRLKYKVIDYLSRNCCEPLLMTNSFDGGIELDEPQLDSKHLAIWFEAVWNCFTGLAACFDCDLDGVLEKIDSRDIQFVPFMGQDTEFCYSVGLSCVLLGLGCDRICDQIAIQKFVKLDGAKFSSSRNHVIFLDELLDDMHVDLIRLYSLSVLRPYLEDDNNFELDELRELDGKFAEFRSRVAELAGGGSREMPQTLSSERVRRLLGRYKEAMEVFDFRAVYSGIAELMDSIMAGGRDAKEGEDLGCLLLMLKPIMPSLSAEIGSELFGEKWAEADLTRYDHS